MIISLFASLFLTQAYPVLCADCPTLSVNPSHNTNTEDTLPHSKSIDSSQKELLQASIPRMNTQSAEQLINKRPLSTTSSGRTQALMQVNDTDFDSSEVSQSESENNYTATKDSDGFHLPKKALKKRKVESLKTRDVEKLLSPLRLQIDNTSDKNGINYDTLKTIIEQTYGNPEPLDVIKKFTNIKPICLKELLSELYTHLSNRSLKVQFSKLTKLLDQLTKNSDPSQSSTLEEEMESQVITI